MLASGSMSRIIGPMIVVSSYTSYGTGWTFGWITIFMSIPMIFLCVLKERLTTESSKIVEMDLENNNPQSIKT